MNAPRLPVTAVIPTFNEQDRIREAACSASAWADEVIVVDGGSTDETVSAALSAGIRVLSLSGKTIGAQRNLGASNARNPWVFALDTDERVSDELRAQLARVLATPKHRAYRVRMKNIYLGRERKRGRWGRDWHVRVYRRELRYCESRVHEGLEHVADIGTLRGPVLHTPYRDLSHQLTKMITYARWGAMDLHAKGLHISAFGLFGRPVWRFLRDYLAYGNFLDGSYGLLSSTLTAYSAFLKYAFLYELDHSDVPQGEPASAEGETSG